jgi:hypothetical protein
MLIRMPVNAWPSVQHRSLDIELTKGVLTQCSGNASQATVHGLLACVNSPLMHYVDILLLQRANTKVYSSTKLKH